MKKFKKALFDIVQAADDNNVASKVFDIGIISLIIINVILVIADTFELPPNIKKISEVIELVSVIIFTFEYVCRVWTSDLLYPKLSPFRSRIKYIFSFIALIDLFAILPFFIPFVIKIDLRVLRMLRIIRLLRVFKINRYTSALSVIGSVFKRKRSQLLSSIFVVLLLMIIASVLMYNIEHDAQPEAFENAFSALWWAVATLTTVGYGDIYPVTVIGKILSAIIAVLGIGLVAVPTGIISAGFMESIDSKENTEHTEHTENTEHREHTDCKENHDKDGNDEKGEKMYCPYCGKKLK